jgi:hypothetical protein
MHEQVALTLVSATRRQRAATFIGLLKNIGEQKHSVIVTNNVQLRLNLAANHLCSRRILVADERSLFVVYPCNLTSGQ